MVLDSFNLIISSSSQAVLCLQARRFPCLLTFVWGDPHRSGAEIPEIHISARGRVLGGGDPHLLSPMASGQSPLSLWHVSPSVIWPLSPHGSPLSLSNPAHSPRNFSVTICGLQDGCLNKHPSVGTILFHFQPLAWVLRMAPNSHLHGSFHGHSLS